VVQIGKWRKMDCGRSRIQAKAAAKKKTVGRKERRGEKLSKRDFNRSLKKFCRTAWF
jgi:hypothetical protein